MRVVKYIRSQEEKILEESCEVLRKDGIVIFPSDTVYGLLGNALSSKVVDKVIAFKERPPGKPISIFLSDLDEIKKWVKINEKKLLLLKIILPGPFTVILPTKDKVVKKLESEDDGLGIRVPDYPLITKLVRKCGFPLTATSANLHGERNVYNVTSFIKTLSQKKRRLIELVVDRGRLPRNKPSTVMELMDDNLQTLRKGDLTLEKEKQFLSKSESETQYFADRLISQKVELCKGRAIVFVISGELGAGKTVFVKGASEAVGLKSDEIISPSYVVFYEYGISLKDYKRMYHFDLFFVRNKEELVNLEIEKFVEKGNILFFEWGKKLRISSLRRMIKESCAWLVTIEVVSEDRRKITISSIK